MASITSPGADPEVMVREIEGELVALDTRDNQVHQLNATASLIWRLANQGQSAEEIVTAMVSAFAVDLDRARTDVRETLLRLAELKLVARG